jgi:hypothetical protein
MRGLRQEEKEEATQRIVSGTLGGVCQHRGLPQRLGGDLLIALCGQRFDESRGDT